MTKMECFQNRQLISTYFFANEVKEPYRSTVPYSEYEDLINDLKSGNAIWASE